MTQLGTDAPGTAVQGGPTPGSGVPVPTVTMADRFSMTLPADWMVLPLDPRTRDRRIAALVDREFGKRDGNATLRRQKIVRLRKSAAQAAENGAFFAALHGKLVGEVAMAASVLVSMLPPLKGPDHQVLPDAEMIAASLASETGGGEVLEHSVVELIVGQAARVRMRGGSGMHGEDGREVVGESLHFYVPLPEVDKTLALVFSTPLLPLADAYARLFDLMAVTARWIQTPAEEPTR